MERLLYLGCMVYNRFPDYEIAAKAVLSRLGIKLRDFHEFSCCSSTFMPSVSDTWIYLASYNLALAERREMDIVTLCGTCTGVFKRALLMLRDEALRERVNTRLAELDLSVSGRAGVSHLLEVLTQQRERVEREIRSPLNLKVALQHPCNVFRPREIARFDDPVRPSAMREMVELTGAEAVRYPLEYECCGSALLITSESMGISSGADKLLSARKAGAQAMVVACGNCAYLFDRHRDRIAAVRREAQLPVLFLPQLLGLAFGMHGRELGLEIRGVELG
ncbi:CoB--CoM heterodisulfide reductase iron-sulfur subunit B family protein [Candidatus Pyrohabitans sp.]